MKRLYIEEGTAIARELYLSMLVDRDLQRAFIASTEGGMNIEEVAHRRRRRSSRCRSIRPPATSRSYRPPHRLRARSSTATSQANA